MATQVSAAPTARVTETAPVVGTLGRAGSWRVFMVALLALDAAAMLAAFGVAYLVRFKSGLPLLETPAYSGAFYSSIAFWAVPIWLALFAAFRLYDRQRLFSGFDEYSRIANACTAGLVIEVMFS